MGLKNKMDSQAVIGLAILGTIMGLLIGLFFILLGRKRLERKAIKVITTEEKEDKLYTQLSEGIATPKRSEVASSVKSSRVEEPQLPKYKPLPSFEEQLRGSIIERPFPEP